MTATDGEHELWTKDLAELFTGKGLTTDTGWNFDRVPKVSLFIGSIGPILDQLENGDYHTDLSTSELVGIRIDDGSVAWRDVGAAYGCNMLPCPGAAASSPTEGALPNSGVRLRISGTVTQGADDDQGTWSDDGKVIIEGFDQATGRTTWSFDLGHSQDLLDDSNFPQADASTIQVIAADGSHVLLDLATGEHQPVPDDLVLWCSEETEYEVSPPFDNDRHVTTYTGQLSRFPCLPDGSRTDLPAMIPSWVGSTAGGHITWSDTKAVVSAEVGG
jgi:hypothetical protein